MVTIEENKCVDLDSLRSYMHLLYVSAIRKGINLPFLSLFMIN